MGDDFTDAAAQEGRSRCWSRAAAWCARNRGPLAIGLGAVVVVALAVAGWVLAPDLYAGVYDEPARVQATVTTRASVLAALAGLGALVSIGINLRNSNTALRNAEVAARTLATTQETFRVTERGHQTGRYTAAIEQLGDAEHLPIRLGGIYALQQLALDTTVVGDRNTIREVLAAFVRTTTADRHTTSLVGPVGTRPRTGGMGTRPLPVDVAAALTVLARIHRDDEPGADLRGAHLAGANLRNADLTRANLRGADLSDVNLLQACLIGANLFQADLTGAWLTQADLTGANLTSACLARANLTLVDLTSANLTSADFSGANLGGVKLDDANITGADFDDADLTGTKFGEARGRTKEQIRSGMGRRPGALT